MRILFASLLVTLFFSCDFSISNKPHEPIELYKFSTSTFQLKDILDSIVSTNPDWYYDSTDYFRQLNLNVIYGRDTIAYLLHYSGDHLDWATRPDSAYLALDAFDRLQPKNTLDESKVLTTKQKQQYLEKFKSSVIKLLDSLSKSKPRYVIKPIDNDIKNSRWIICKGLKYKCDTFKMIIDKGDYILSDTFH